MSRTSVRFATYSMILSKAVNSAVLSGHGKSKTLPLLRFCVIREDKRLKRTSSQFLSSFCLPHPILKDVLLEYRAILSTSAITPMFIQLGVLAAFQTVRMPVSEEILESILLFRKQVV